MKLTGKKIMVTGGAGFIGSHLVDQLVAAGNQVIVVDGFSVGKEENLRQHRGNKQVQIVRSDIRDLEEMIRLSRGLDVIFHLAVFCARSSVHDPMQAQATNAAGSASICQASRENDVERLVYVSSVGVYGDAQYFPIDEDHPLRPTNMYGATKAAGEMYARSYCQTYGVPAAIVRLCSTYGPREPSEGRRAEVIPKFVMRTLAGQSPVIMGTGEQSRDFTYVDDVVRGILMAAACDELVGDCVNIGRGHDVSIRAVCHMILHKLGREDLEPVYVSDGQPPQVDKMVADVGKARRLFGFSADTDINTGLDRYIDWVRGQTLDLASWIKQDQVGNPR